MDRYGIYGPAQLSSQPHIYDTARAAMFVLQQAGIVAKDRTPLSGESEAVWIEDNGTAAIAVFYETECGKLWLDLVFVEPRHRRKGFATALLGRVAGVAAERGIGKVMFGTNLDNDAMRRVGEKVGFLSDHVVLSRSIALPAAAAAS